MCDRQPKAFSWHGDLCLASESKTETCKVQVSNVSPADGLSFGAVLDGVKVIEAAPMYDFTDFEESLISSFQPPTQSAHLSADGGDDSLFNVVAEYMTEYRKVSR